MNTISERHFVNRATSRIARLRRTVCALTLLSGLAVAPAITASDEPTPDTAIVDYTSRVIGGTRSATGQWPWAVAMIFDGRGPLSFRQFCGGTAIAERWVLTAAHCLYDFNEERMTLDSFTIAADFINLATENPQEISPINTYIHPLYDNTDPTAQHDLALIELASDLPVAALTPFVGDTEALSGELAYTMGWGAIDYTNPDNPTYPNDLRHAAVPLVSLSTCNAASSYNGAITEYQVCAGYAAGGVDSCVGDSGGPLVMPIDGTWRQVGIVSFGRGCAEANFYGVYTNVSNHALWINDYVSGYRDAGSAGSGGISTGGTTSGSGDIGAAASGSDTGAFALPLLITLGALLHLRRPRRAALPDTRACRSLGLLGCLLALVLSSCMSTQSIARLDDSAERLGIDTAHLGDSRDAVMTAVFGSTDASDCQYHKVGLAESPRPIRLEICSRDEPGIVLDGQAVQRVTAHFVDDRLARLTFAASGDPVLEAWQSMLTTRFGEAAVRPSPTSSLGVLVWEHGDDEARLENAGPHDTAGLELILVDARLEHRASWLR